VRTAVGMRARSLCVRVADGLLLDNVDIDIAAGACTYIGGRSGAGKTTLLRALVGLLPTYACTGVVEVGNDDKWTAWQPTMRGSVACLMLQSSADTLHPLHVVAGLVQQPLLAHGRPSMTTDETDAFLGRFDVAHLAQRRAHELSGGERQRVLLAQCLVLQPRVLLLDEPCAAQDTAHRAQLMDMLRTHANDGMAVAVASHDLGWHAFAQRRYVVEHGRMTNDERLLQQLQAAHEAGWGT
jgi:ABC-type glutathione transport system ATPase component